MSIKAVNTNRVVRADRIYPFLSRKLWWLKLFMIPVPIEYPATCWKFRRSGCYPADKFFPAATIPQFDRLQSKATG